MKVVRVVWMDGQERSWTAADTVWVDKNSGYPEHYQPMCRTCHRRFDGARRRAELIAHRMRP